MYKGGGLQKNSCIRWYSVSFNSGHSFKNSQSFSLLRAFDSLRELWICQRTGHDLSHIQSSSNKSKAMRNGS